MTHNKAASIIATRKAQIEALEIDLHGAEIENDEYAIKSIRRQITLYRGIINRMNADYA